MLEKHNIDSLAFFGGPVIFDRPRSTSNLLQPDIDAFLRYSETIFTHPSGLSHTSPLISQVERALTDFHQARFCKLFSSGFWALVYALKLVALEGKTEIIMPSLTYRRMADIAAWLHLKIKYCEVDAQTLSVTPETIKRVITDETAVILAPHPIVNCCHADEITDLSRELGIPVVFDSVESVYEHYNGKKIGSYGNAECFSLHACKLLNGFGGGYLTTNNEDLIKKLEGLELFPMMQEDNSSFHHLNINLNPIHAAMVLASFDDLKQQVQRNKHRYERYYEGFLGFEPVHLLEFDVNESPSYKNIVISLSSSWRISRNLIIDILNAENILARAYYYPALHLKSSHIPHEYGDLSMTEALSMRLINLPCGQLVNREDIDLIISCLKFIYEHQEDIIKRTL